MNEKLRNIVGGPGDNAISMENDDASDDDDVDENNDSDDEEFLNNSAGIYPKPRAKNP